MSINISPAMPNDATDPPPDLLNARDACALLGISQSTLYAYVSRGLLRSRPGADHRSRVYLRQDVERLAGRKRSGRGRHRARRRASTVACRCWKHGFR